MSLTKGKQNVADLFWLSSALLSLYKLMLCLPGNCCFGRYFLCWLFPVRIWLGLYLKLLLHFVGCRSFPSFHWMGGGNWSFGIVQWRLAYDKQISWTLALYELYCPVSLGCRIHWLHLCRGVRPPPTSVLDMTLNNLMVRFQQCWSFGECGVPLHCHHSQVHSGPEW